MPRTKKAKTMTKAEMVVEMHRLAKEMAGLRAAAEGVKSKIFDELDAQREAMENPERGGLAFGALAQQIVSGLPLREFAVKATIGFIYGYTLGVAGSSVMTALSLLMMPSWINFVIGVLVAMSMLYIAFTTVVPVSNFTYNTVAKLVAFAKREALAARDWVEKTAHDIRLEQATREAAHASAQQ